MHFALFFFFQAEDGIRDLTVTGVQTCALPILAALTYRLLDGFFGGGARPTDWIAAFTEAARLDRARADSILAAGGSGERRVGEEGRSRWAPYHLKKKKRPHE